MFGWPWHCWSAWSSCWERTSHLWNIEYFNTMNSRKSILHEMQEIILESNPFVSPELLFHSTIISIVFFLCSLAIGNIIAVCCVLIIYESDLMWSVKWTNRTTHNNKRFTHPWFTIKNRTTVSIWANRVGCNFFYIKWTYHIEYHTINLRLFVDLDLMNFIIIREQVQWPLINIVSWYIKCPSRSGYT